MLEYLNLPNTKATLTELTDSALHVLAKPDVHRDRMSIVMAALVQSTQPVADGMSAVIDRDLFEWCRSQAKEMTT